MIKKCIFPVAGFGTRFLPVTKSVPKELLPIIDKPLIHYAIQEAYDSNIYEMIFIVNKYKKTIKDYLEKHPYLESLISGSKKEEKLASLNKIINTSKFTFQNQTEMLGLGHAIYQGRKYIGNNSFAVILPDDLCDNSGNSVLSQMIEVSSLYPDKCVVAIEEVDPENVCNYGVIDGQLLEGSSDIFMVQNMVEKPDVENAPSNLAIIGRYILIPEIFKSLDETLPDANGEIQVTNALLKLAKQKKVLAYKFKGKRIDCGSPEGYLEANNFFYHKQSQS
jgi:UTP--glucose-1-phosphate uridylyltransferase